MWVSKAVFNCSVETVLSPVLLFKLFCKFLGMYERHLTKYKNKENLKIQRQQHKESKVKISVFSQREGPCRSSKGNLPRCNQPNSKH